MSPDFGYYVGAQAFASAAHSVPGLFHSCLPTSIALLFILLYFSESLSAPLPAPHRQLVRAALSESSPLSFVRAVFICASVVIGAATHVIWDSFTHEARAGVHLLPFLDIFLFAVAEWQVHVYSVLQHLSTVVGIACLLLCYRRAARSVGNEAISLTHEAARRRILVRILVASVLLGTAAAFVWTSSTAPFLVTRLIVRTVVCATSVFVLAYLTASIHANQAAGEA
jgi:hypothetical protein